MLLDMLIYALIDMFFPGGGKGWSVKRDGFNFIFMNYDATIGGSKDFKNEGFEREDILDKDIDLPITDNDFYDGPDW